MNIKVELPGGAEPTQGQMITFTAPLDGSDVDYLEINGKQYWFMGADKHECIGRTDGWEAGALVAVVMDVINGYAFVLNPNMTATVQSSLRNIQRQLNRLTIPTSMWSPTYDGSVQYPRWNDATAENVCDMTGETEAVDAGTHYVTFTIKDEYADMWTWEDGTSDPKTVPWEIKRATTNYPFASMDAVYNGNPQSPTWHYNDEDRVTAEGTMSATNAGTYDVTFTLTKNYSWNDGSTGPYTVQWYILRQIVDVPTQSGTLTFNNANQSPSWSGYDTAKMTISAGNTGMHAGGYTTTFVTTDNYCFSRYGSTITYETEKTANWTIGQKVLTMSVSPTSLSLDAANDTATIQVTHNGYNDGNLSLSCQAGGNTSGLKLTSNNDNWTVTVQAISTCEENVTISLVTTKYLDYSLPTAQVVPVTATMVDSTLENNSWETIHSISAAGQAANYWSVGDGKEITIKGTVDSALVDTTVTAYIIGINHNAAKEGDNLTHFCIGRSGSTEIALYCGTGFKMNSTDSAGSGWPGSLMYRTTLGNSGTPSDPVSNSLMSALPAELLAVLRPVTKGQATSNSTSAIESSTCYLFLLGEVEIFGVTGQSHSTELTCQKQYAYYVAGNSKNRYNDKALTSGCAYWARSPMANGSGRFDCVSAPAGSTCAGERASSKLGIAPCFCV